MKKQIILLIVCGVVILLIWSGAGVFYKMQAEKANATIKTLNSKLISPIMAFGEIKDISSGKILTLSTLGYNKNTVVDTIVVKIVNTIVVKIKDSAKILDVENGVQKEIAFQDLKVGDFVNVTLNITQDYGIEGSKVFIVPIFLPPSGSLPPLPPSGSKTNP